MNSGLWLILAVPCVGPVDALRERLRHESLSREERKRIRDWSDCISGSSAAQYLLNVISSIDVELLPRRALWLVCQSASPPVTVGSGGPRSGSGDEFHEKLGATRGGRS